MAENNVEIVRHPSESEANELGDDRRGRRIRQPECRRRERDALRPARDPDHDKDHAIGEETFTPSWTVN